MKYPARINRGMRVLILGWFGILIPLLTTPEVTASTQNARAYLVHYAPLAQSLSQQTGIPASVILGIALIESGHGSSTNCRMLKNHFGIKGVNYLPSKGVSYHSKYHSYTSDEASYGHFCSVIQRKGYCLLLKGNPNPMLWLRHINARYYSSAGKIWLNRVANAIRVHRLTRFDKPLPKVACSPRPWSWHKV